MSATIISVQCKNRYSASPKFINGTWIFSIHYLFETLNREMGGQAWSILRLASIQGYFPTVQRMEIEENILVVQERGYKFFSFRIEIINLID